MFLFYFHCLQKELTICDFYYKICIAMMELEPPELTLVGEKT